MGWFSKLFGADTKSIHDTCIKMYHKFKNKRPNKNERDYLKMVLLTKPPFDYLMDYMIDRFLDEVSTIEQLAALISENCKPNNYVGRGLWEQRERNLKNNYQFKVKERNQQFFEYFWS